MTLKVVRWRKTRKHGLLAYNQRSHNLVGYHFNCKIRSNKQRFATIAFFCASRSLAKSALKIKGQFFRLAYRKRRDGRSIE